MPRRRKELVEIDEPPDRPLVRPCDRCGKQEARRFGRAQVVAGERGLRWVDVGLCDRCAVRCAAPGSGSASALGAEHSICAPSGGGGD